MALIELKNIQKIFTMGKEEIRALNEVSFQIEKGELIAIVGSSGCGKSTLMNVIGLLDNPSQGEYLLEGKLVSTLSDDEKAQIRNQKIGFVFQSFNLLPRASALRNVQVPLIYSSSYGKKYTHQQMQELGLEALKRVGLDTRADHKPSELSGGQRQRVAIARAMINNPPVLLADEPTGNLDSKSGKEILEIFEKLSSQGVTIILVTHDPTIAARAHRIVTMFDGRVKSDVKNTNREVDNVTH